MLNNFFKIILIILSINTTGCAILLSPLSSKEFELYTTNRFEELNNYLKKSGGTLSDNAKQRILKENINKIRMNQNTTLEFVRYQVNKKYYIETLMEMGEFTKALSYCDETLKEFYMISDLLSKCNYQHEVTIDNNNSLIYDLLHLKGYLVWFNSKAGDKKITLEKFKEATTYVSSISKRNMFDSEIQQKLIFLFDDAMFYEKIIGDYKKALKNYEKVIKLTETLGFTSIDMKYGSYMQAYQRMMNLYIKLGELQRAQQILEEYQKLTDTSIFKAGDFVVHQIPRWRENLAILYTDYGVLYSRLQENSKSKEYFDKAFNIVKEIDPQTKNGIEREALGRYYILYGTYYVGHVLWKYDEAQKCIDQGLSFLKPDYYTRIRDQFDLETAYLFSGEIHFLNKDYDNALKRAENAITYSTKIHNIINVARAYTLIGKIWNERKEYKKAKSALQIANEIITKEKVESTENYELFYSMGQVYESTDANQSLKYYKKAVEEVEKLWKGRFKNTQKQVSFIDNRLVVFEPVIRMLVKQGKTEEAINYMERSKSRTLSDDTQYYSVTENVNVKDMDISNTISYRQVKNLASGKTAFLEYYIGKESVIAAIITKKGVHFKELQITPKKLIKDVTAFRLALGDPSYPYKTWGFGLYSILVKPFSKYLSGYESICIVPHGVLHNLPFHALSTDEEKPLFLIDKYKLSYSPSLTVLNFAFKSHNHNNKIKFLGIGNSLEVDIRDLNLKHDNYLPGLRFINDEVREVGSLFKDNEKTILMDNKAVKSAVINNSYGFDIILFSAHAMLIEEKPQQSCIFLHEDSESNGRLTILDIERLNLKSNLVILSACETGRVSGYEGNANRNEYDAKYPLGDDLVGLQRAFIKAGSSSVLSTLWFVDDEATKSLIVDFVKGYKTGEDKVTALRDAILKLKRIKEKESKNDWEHPYFWAPFILSGDWR